MKAFARDCVGFVRGLLRSVLTGLAVLAVCLFVGLVAIAARVAGFAWPFVCVACEIASYAASEEFDAGVRDAGRFAGCSLPAEPSREAPHDV